tara:strand:+ start:56 stop:259 length:204 start_codon:yes stop_codon:yes gene_type:complete
MDTQDYKQVCAEIKDLGQEIKLLKKDILNITKILMMTEIRKPNKSELKLHDNDWSYEDPQGTIGSEY